MMARSVTALRLGLTFIERVALFVARMLVVAIVVTLAAQVFSRFLLNASLIWSEEVSAWCMVWVVYMGSAALMHRDEHVAIPMFVRLLPMPLRVAAILLGRIAALAGVIFVAYYGVYLVLAGFNLVSQTTGINTRWVKLCIPIGMGMMSVFALAHLVSDVARLITGGPLALTQHDRSAPGLPMVDNLPWQPRP